MIGMQICNTYSKGSGSLTQVTYQGVSQLCVRVRTRTPSRWNIRRTARLVPMLCPDSTVIMLPIRPALCESMISKQKYGCRRNICHIAKLTSLKIARPLNIGFSEKFRNMSQIEKSATFKLRKKTFKVTTELQNISIIIIFHV